MTELELTPHYPRDMVLGGVTFIRDELAGRELVKNGYEAEATYSGKIGNGQILVCFERLPKLAEGTYEDEEELESAMCEDRAGFRNVILRTGAQDLGLLLDPSVSDWKAAAVDMIQFHQQNGFSSKFDLNYEKYQLGIYAVDLLSGIADSGMPNFMGKNSNAAVALMLAIMEEVDKAPCFGTSGTPRLNASSIASCFSAALKDAPENEVNQYKADLQGIANALLTPKLRSEITL
jgi:hypothetical protein